MLSLNDDQKIVNSHTGAVTRAFAKSHPALMDAQRYAEMAAKAKTEYHAARESLQALEKNPNTTPEDIANSKALVARKLEEAFVIAKMSRSYADDAQVEANKLKDREAYA